MKTAILLFISLVGSIAHTRTYTCTTEFGEAVPLKLTVLKRGETCGSCGDANFNPPLKIVDVKATREWNKDVAEDTSQSSKRKRKVYSLHERSALIDWRYMKQPGPSFRLSIECPQNQTKCRGSFLDQASPSEFRIETRLADRRRPNNRGWVEFALSDRENLDFRVRIFKDAIGDAAEKSGPVSASGERIFVRDEPDFIMDVGVDEHLKLFENVRHRLAALEIKIRCKDEAAR